MGVVRYKSTGDMLEAAELVLARPKKQQIDSEDDDDEVARKRPLLKGAQNQPSRVHSSNASNKWGSCKLLGCHNNDNKQEDKYDLMLKMNKTSKLYDDEEASIESKKWIVAEQENPDDLHKLRRQHQHQVKLPKSKSQANDMLAFNLKETQVMNKSNKRNSKNKEEELLEAASLRLMRPADWSEPQLVCDSGIECATIDSATEDSHSHHHHHISRKTSTRVCPPTSGALRKRRAARIKLASLSLSSPVLSLREDLHSSNSLSSVSGKSGKAHLLRRLRNNDRRALANYPSCLQRRDSNDDAGRPMLAPQPVDVHASETKAEESKSACDRFNDCFIVDVGRLEQQQQHQQQVYLKNAAALAETSQNSCYLAFADSQKDAVGPSACLPANCVANDNRSERLKLLGSTFQTSVGGLFHKDGQSGLVSSTWPVRLANNNNNKFSFEQESHYFQQVGPASTSQTRHALKGAVKQQQEQQQLSYYKVPIVPGRAQTDIDTETVNNKLMVDLNSTAGCFMGSCCNTWRQALNPNTSGSYKVARNQNQQHYQQLISGRNINLETDNTSQANDSEQETVCANYNNSSNNINNNNDNSHDNNNRLEPLTQQVDNAQRSAVAKERRIKSRSLRPSRSPISLQRQTNARLTWHRIKLQQQRQEQLAQLALRERQQLDQQIHHFNYQQRYQTQNSSRRINNENQFGEIKRGTRSTEHDHGSFYLINGLYNRYPLPAKTINSSSSSSSYYDNQGPIAQQQQQPQPNIKRENTLSSNNRSGNQIVKQQHVIVPTTISGSIEICDNQPACSSRQEQICQSGFSNGQQQLEVSESNSNNNNNNKQARISGNTNRGGNVIIYKSINMLTGGGSSSASRQQYHHLGNIRRSGSECDSINFDDAQTISSSASTLSLNKPFCKICHVGATKNGDKLISPCKCSGTMQYIHCGCLLKWLEISNRANEKPMNCELCAHEYTWHKKFNYKHMKLPRCSLKDFFLHIIFLVAIGAMLLSALSPMLYRKPVQEAASTSSSLSTPETATANSHRYPSANIDEQQKNRRQVGASYHSHTSFSGANHLATSRLAHHEKFMLLCAASFFVSFFFAIYVQTRARDTLYGLVVKFLNMNQTYYITEYDHGKLNGVSNNMNSDGSNSKQQQLPVEESRKNSVLR